MPLADVSRRILSRPAQIRRASIGGVWGDPEFARRFNGINGQIRGGGGPRFVARWRP
ncbi:hypothetical protein GGD81_003096 [Rhodobium orientis]|uniref:hypothetical protein n=1 Tax=Rhodobium orientis TaxID=34017 RepID=UPI0014761093|nr:hypothetical protein [Rhodobium orientis]MBB4304041.1 hypothetical protein [Rhodobium orientis]